MITKRIPLKKTVRFEVFKRDKFTCQYCGLKAPDIVLHVDHIEPVSKGGNSDIVNLITSCFDCNMGKKGRVLSDNSVVEKQRKQMELLQERREQIELMFEWKKSLSKMDDETLGTIIEYAEAKMGSFTINENGRSKMAILLKRHSISDLLDAIDISATQYLKPSNGGFTQESAEYFLDKIGGIIFNKKLSPIQQKIAYIKNIAKSNFNYYDPKQASIILNQYVKVLETYWHWDDDVILNDLDSEVTLRTQECRNWSEWRGILDGWIESIKKPKDQEQEKSPTWTPEELSPESLRDTFENRKLYLQASIEVFHYILKVFPGYKKKDVESKLNRTLFALTTTTIPYDVGKSPSIYSDESEWGASIHQFISSTEMKDVFSFELTEDSKNNDFLSILEPLARQALSDVFWNTCFSGSEFTEKDSDALRNVMRDYLKANAKLL